MRQSRRPDWAWLTFYRDSVVHMPFFISIYDRSGRGLRLPEGGGVDLSCASPALVRRSTRIDLPMSSIDEHPRIDPVVLDELHRRIEGAQWLT